MTDSSQNRHPAHCRYSDPIQDHDKDTRLDWRSVLFLLRTQLFRFSQFLVYAEILTLALLLFSHLSPTFPADILPENLLSPDSSLNETGFRLPFPVSAALDNTPSSDDTIPRETSDPAKSSDTGSSSDPAHSSEKKNNYIHWVDFTVTNEALRQALRLDVDSYTSDCHLNWIELLAYLAAHYGGDFSHYKAADMDALAEKRKSGISMETLTDGMKYYPYYLEAYTAVLGGMVGTYEIQEAAPQYHWVHKYGLKAFSPIAKYFPYQDFDDFGASRSYGFERQHLGHDLMGQVGTPVIAVESGYVEAIGWNQYGGWRLGIRSFDKKRYYYYAHLRKNYPYHKSLKEGSIVQAGDVIGYLGRTGYSRTENTNNIEEPHLHFGMQLIFDESQKDGNNEIWINCYEIVKFLQLNRSETVKNPETKEYSRVLDMKDPSVQEYKFSESKGAVTK